MFEIKGMFLTPISIDRSPVSTTWTNVALKVACFLQYRQVTSISTVCFLTYNMFLVAVDYFVSSKVEKYQWKLSILSFYKQTGKWCVTTHLSISQRNTITSGCCVTMNITVSQAWPSLDERIPSTPAQARLKVEVLYCERVQDWGVQASIRD